MKDLKLKDKVVVVTGSSRGWGRGVAILFGKYGCNVVVNGTVKEDVDRVAEEVSEAGGGSAAVTVSVTSQDGPSRLVDTALERFGRIDVLVNNAGRLRTSSLIDMSDEDWDKVIDIQLRAPFRCAKVAASAMIKAGKGGSIINVAGAAGIRGMYANANHAASKAGLLAATWTWALELRNHGIRVNAVRATVESAMSLPLLEESRRSLGRADADATNRELGFLPSLEAAKLLVWLASAPAEHINGQFIGMMPGKITLWDRAQPLREFPVGADDSVEEIASRLSEDVAKLATMSKGVGEIVPGLDSIALATFCSMTSHVSETPSNRTSP
jgi:NAD(P)-dependent dehydrogenase (short-subunit alcohol dehydrogenase family)